MRWSGSHSRNCACGRHGFSMGRCFGARASRRTARRRAPLQQLAAQLKRDARASSDAARVTALAGTVERIGRDPAPPARRARLHFREEWVSAAADCNSFGARVTPGRAGFTISEGAATEMGCDPERMAFDDRLFAAVGKARRWTALAQGRIRLEGAGEPLVLRRPAPASPGLPGT